MERIGQPITKVPSLGYKDLDLHRLFHAVITRGGMDEVTRKQEWKLVYQELEIPTMSTSASYNTRTNYKKYLYLYELEVCDWGEIRPSDAAPPRFKVGDYVRIESSTYEGQVFYAQIAKYRYRNHTNSYYVHYNGWSTSHDEWMPEAVLDNLRQDEQRNPATLANPSPTRSSKSNYIIYDPMVSERHHHPAQPNPSQTPVQQQAQMDAAQVPSERSTPRTKRMARSKGSEDELGYDEAGQSNQFTSSPASYPSSSARRRRGNSRKDTSSTLLCDEWDHPVHEDQLHGYPKQRRDSNMLFDFDLDEPEQVYYNGGQWKHTTPRVRKFNLHKNLTIGQDRPQFAPIDPQVLERSLVMPKVKLPEIPPLPKEIKWPKLTVAIPSIDPTTLDQRSTKEIKAAIAEKEARLRYLHRDYKQKAKLLKRYYGKSVEPSSLLRRPSPFAKMARRS